MDRVIELVGRTSQWRRRMRSDGGGAVIAAWLRPLAGAGGGVVGVYLPEERVPDGAALPARTQAFVRAVLRPLRVHALDGDHRLPQAPDATLFALEAQEAAPWDRMTPPLPWEGVPVVLAAPSRVVGAGRLADLVDLPDMCGWFPDHAAPAGETLAIGCAVGGVTAEVGGRSWLRPLLWLAAPADQTAGRA
jgi:hypothetical protein